MKNFSKKNENTFLQLNRKAKDIDVRMPSIKSIEELLKEAGVNFNAYDSINVVEHKTRGRVYVNGHNGKKGRKIEIRDDVKGLHFSVDTSESYYSINSWGYAQTLVSIIEKY